MQGCVEQCSKVNYNGCCVVFSTAYTAVMAVHIWWRAAETFVSLTNTFPSCETPLYYNLLVMSPPLFNNLLYRQSKWLGPSHFTGHWDRYLFDKLTREDGQCGISMIIWPEEKPMIIYFCRLKTRQYIYSCAHIPVPRPPSPPWNDSPGLTERRNSSLPSEILALL